MDSLRSTRTAVAASVSSRPAHLWSPQLPMSLPLPVVDIVDDDLDVLRSLGRTLSANGYRVCMFASARQYLKTIEEGKASCVVISIDMRGCISGLQLGKAILTSRRPVPIIYVARTPDPALREQAFLAGCVAYVEEPVSSESLIAAIALSGAQRLSRAGEPGGPRS